MRNVITRGAILAALVVGACASPGVPPGGPIDTEAPQIVGVAPDSGSTDVRPKNVVFRFNEVVSERPSGAQSLGALFLISPREGEPSVDWSRDEIAIRPRDGWRPNTAYTITLLPGLSDLRGNTRNTGATTIFSTGPTIPSGRITGTLFNWTEGRIAPRGLVEARIGPDTSLVYVASSDSSGNFVLANLPPGRYTVRGLIDDNNNRGLDPREAWDSVGVTLAESANIELLAFIHDSIGARLSSVSVRDSVTLSLTFDNSLSAQLPATANVRVTGSDSTDIPVTAVALPPADTAASVEGAAPAGAPRPAGPGATPGSARPAERRPSRPPPVRTVIVRLARPLRPGLEYRVRVTDVRNLTGLARNSERTVVVPAASPRPPAPAIPPPVAPPRR